MVYKSKSTYTQTKNIHFSRTHTNQNIHVKGHEFYGKRGMGMRYKENRERGLAWTSADNVS